MCAGLGRCIRILRVRRLLPLLQMGENRLSGTYMRDGFAFLQTMIDREYLDVERSLETLPGSDEEAAFFAEGKCAFISSLCRAAAFCQGLPVCSRDDRAAGAEGSPSVLWVRTTGWLSIPIQSILARRLPSWKTCVPQIRSMHLQGSWGRYPQHAEMRPPRCPRLRSLYPVWHPEARFPIRISRSRLIPGNTIKELCVELCEGRT